jgi:glycosyltransferase involved in cell wall biosynthesis
VNTVYFFARYGSYAASSRLRVFSLFNSLSIENYSKLINVFFKDNRFALNGLLQKIKFLFTLLLSVVKRIYFVLRISKNDIVFIQYELVPFFPSWLEMVIKKRGAKLVLDFDDAFHLSYQHSSLGFLQKKYDTLISNADLIITGSPSLTKYMLHHNKNVIEIPTTVPSLYDVHPDLNPNQTFSIGWIGSATTSKYLDQIAPILMEFLGKHQDAELILIGYSGNTFQNSSNIQVITWSESNEKNYLPKIDVGVMPLVDDAWSNGKCGFKLIQYMAAGKPTISTPLQANKKIDDGIGNLFATSSTEWLDALEYFHEHNDIAQAIGTKNRIRAEEQYIFSAVLPKYNDAFNSLFNSISAN